MGRVLLERVRPGRSLRRGIPGRIGPAARVGCRRRVAAVAARWRELFYLSLDRQLMAVDVTLQGSRLRFGPPHELFPINSAVFEPNRLPIATQRPTKPYSPAPDGQKFLFAMPAGEATPAPLTLVVRSW